LPLLHSMALANLNKSEELVTNTTTASKYMSMRPRICNNGNPLFQTSLLKIFKNCWSKSYFTTFTFRGTFNKQIWVWKGGFQMMQILDLLGMYFDAWVVFVTNSLLLFRLAMAILCIAYLPAYLDSLNVEKVSL